jgi:transketolase
VDNRSSSYGWGRGGIEAHCAVSGWSAVRVSGRDHAALASAFRVTSAGAASGFGGGPQLVVATVEGKG